MEPVALIASSKFALPGPSAVAWPTRNRNRGSDLFFMVIIIAKMSSA